MSTTMQHVVDVTDATFEQVVVEGSAERPVVIDLWADWCGPCKTLGPILEKVAGERDGAFLLAKLDVDANPMVAGALFSALGSQSIPTVVAFRDGQPVDAFIGAYPENAVNEFIDALVPSDADLVADEAKAEEAIGDLPGAEQGYRDALERDPDSREAAVGLARILVDRGELTPARELATPFLPDPDAERVLAAARVQEWGTTGGENHLGRAKAAAAQGRWREALEGMLTALDGDRESAREAMVDVFTTLGAEDPLVQEFRAKLAARLY